MVRVIGEGAQGRCTRLGMDGHPLGVVIVVQRFQRIVLDQPLGRFPERSELAAAIHPELTRIGCAGEEGSVRGIQADHEGAHIAFFSGHLRGEGGGQESLLGGTDGAVDGTVIPGIRHDAVLGGPRPGGQGGDGGGGKGARQVPAVREVCSFGQNVT